MQQLLVVCFLLFTLVNSSTIINRKKVLGERLVHQQKVAQFPTKLPKCTIVQYPGASDHPLKIGRFVTGYEVQDLKPDQRSLANCMTGGIDQTFVTFSICNRIGFGYSYLISIYAVDKPGYMRRN